MASSTPGMARKNSSTPQKQPAAKAALSNPSATSSGPIPDACVLSNSVRPNITVPLGRSNPPSLSCPPRWNTGGRVVIPGGEGQVVHPPAGDSELGRHLIDRPSGSLAGGETDFQSLDQRPVCNVIHLHRSEERRVGKEGRCPWS